MINKTRHYLKRLFAVLLLVALTVPIIPGKADAETGLVIDQIGFNPDLILSDNDIFNENGMSYDYLVNFARSKGVLADLMVEDIDGDMKTAVDVIWRVSRNYKMNPKYLLALLQKEQSLVEDPEPSERQLAWAMGYGVCDSCSKDDPRIQDFRGFANQVEYAARQHREKYLMQLLTYGKTIAGKGIGITMEIDGIVVTPKNQATAMLYSYTPHIHGNLNLWKIWKQWFSLEYPNGTIVKGMPSGETYMIQFGQKRKFASPSVLLSMTDPNKIIEGSDTDLSAYPDGDPVKYPKFALLKDPNGTIYLNASDGKRRIANMATFRQFGFSEDDIIEVPAEDVAILPDAAPINEQTVFPQGALVKANESPTVYYVENNKKYALQDEVFLKLYFTRRPIVSVPALTINSYADAGIYKLKDGELVKGSGPDVFVVEESELRPIPSEDVFLSMGYKWNNIVTIPDRVLLSYNQSNPVGQTNLAVENLDTAEVSQAIINNLGSSSDK
ncbi:hypothetical protein GF391_01205 [Candidatus Uhrbacteria bacterium]|nr:hypothetical protein [Candidatus Uhrbacteria bacterium]